MKFAHLPGQVLRLRVGKTLRVLMEIQMRHYIGE